MSRNSTHTFVSCVCVGWRVSSSVSCIRVGSVGVGVCGVGVSVRGVGVGVGVRAVSCWSSGCTLMVVTFSVRFCIWFFAVMGGRAQCCLLFQKRRTLTNGPFYYLYSTSAIFEGRFSLITWKLLNYHTCAVWQIFNSSSHTILDATHPSTGIRSIQNSVFGFVQYLLHMNWLPRAVVTSCSFFSRNWSKEGCVTNLQNSAVLIMQIIFWKVRGQ